MGAELILRWRALGRRGRTNLEERGKACFEACSEETAHRLVKGEIITQSRSCPNGLLPAGSSDQMPRVAGLLVCSVSGQGAACSI